jgi:type VI secretion system FHA domain protein
MLRIAVISHNAVALDEPIMAEFAGGGTIGRAPGSTLMLPDPDRVISRTHAVVALRDGAYVIRDQGTTVPLLLNGRPVGQGHEAPVAIGDELRIGGYTLKVDLAPLDASADATLDSTATATLRPGTVLSWNEEGGPAPDRIETVFVTKSPHGAAVSQAGAGERAQPSPSRSATSTGPSGDPARDAASPTAAPSAPPTGGRPATAPGASALALQRAFLQGAGVPDLALPHGFTPALLEELGCVMREALRGMIDLLVARAEAKREVRADATIIVAQDNNPLKFAPDLDAVVMHLLQPRGKGFMPPLPAIRDAQDSLRSHQAGFVAGMRAALESVVARFDPAHLEARLTATAPTHTLLPVNHRAKLWEMYEELYEQISREAQADFNQLFREEFLRAYQAKVDAHRERRDAAT